MANKNVAGEADYPIPEGGFGETAGGAPESGGSPLVPPQSPEAERSVLGELLANQAAIDQVAALLGPESFYDAGHRKIFECILSLYHDGQPTDIVTVASRLRDTDDLERVGGVDALADLVDVQGASNLQAYTVMIQKYWVLRSLITASGKVREMAFNARGRNPKSVIDDAEATILKVADSLHDRSKNRTVMTDKLTAEVTEYIEKLSQRKNKTDIIGVPTGLRELDEKTSGMQPGDLAVIAGRPGMGKTSLALDVVRHVADDTRHCDYGHDVLMFSMEMTGAQLLMRLLGNLGSIRYHALRTGRLDERDMGRIMPVMGQIESLNLAINDTDSMTVMQIRAEARRHCRWLKSKGRMMTMVVVDYLQLVRGEGRDDGSENRAQVVATITRGLKSLARELNVVVLALSQLNRAVEARTGGNRRPMLADLRESGSIEQDADIILFLYRDHVYNPAADPTEAEVIIGKHRNGPTGMVKVSFRSEFSSFRNRAADEAH